MGVIYYAKRDDGALLNLGKTAGRISITPEIAEWARNQFVAVVHEEDLAQMRDEAFDQIPHAHELPLPPEREVFYKRCDDEWHDCVDQPMCAQHRGACPGCGAVRREWGTLLPERDAEQDAADRAAFAGARLAEEKAKEVLARFQEAPVAHLALRRENNALWSPADCLRQAAADLDAGEVRATRALVLLLSDADDAYTVSHYSASLRRSEGLALMRVAEMKFLREMGF